MNELKIYIFRKIPKTLLLLSQQPNIFQRLSCIQNDQEHREGVEYDRNRIFRPDTGMEAKSGSGIAGKGMLFQNSGSGKAGKGMLF